MLCLVSEPNYFAGLGLLRADRSAAHSLLETQSVPVLCRQVSTGTRRLPEGKSLQRRDAGGLEWLRAWQCSRQPPRGLPLTGPVYTASLPLRWPLCTQAWPPQGGFCSPARRLLTKLCFFQSQRIAWSAVFTESMDSLAISSKCSLHSLQPKKVWTYLLMVWSTAWGSASKPADGRGTDRVGPAGACPSPRGSGWCREPGTGQVPDPGTRGTAPLVCRERHREKAAAPRCSLHPEGAAPCPLESRPTARVRA